MTPHLSTLLTSLKYLTCTSLIIFQLWSLPPVKEVRPFQTKGETLKYEITYLDLTGGYITLASLPVGDQLKLNLYGSTSKWVDSIFNLKIYFAAMINNKTFQAKRFISSKKENDHLEYYQQEFDPTHKTLTYSQRNQHDPIKKEVVNIDGDGTDILTLLHYGRTTSLKVGESYPISTFIKTSKREAKIKVLRKQEVEINYQKNQKSVNTVVITPEMSFRGLMTAHKSFEIFYSDDPYKVPVLIQLEFDFGSIKLELVDGHPNW